MITNIGYVNRKKDFSAPKIDMASVNGKMKKNPLVEVGVLIADYAQKDDDISALWFKPIGEKKCIAVLEFTGDSNRIARNINVMAYNEDPEVDLRLYSSNSDTGQKIIEGARLLYRKPPEKPRKQYKKRKKVAE